MIKGFEDAFTDAQARIIALSLELLENAGKEADKVFVYIFQNDHEDYIEPFFEKNGDIFTQNDWFSSEEIEEFSDCGIEDIENIIDICKAYDSECPHVIKLIYNVQTESFDAEYDYEDVAEVYDKDVPVIVEEWVEKCKSNYKVDLK